MGNDNVDSSVLAIPYISLLQSLSKACTEGTADYIEGARPGKFLNSVTKEISDNIICANMFMNVIFTANKKRNLGDDFKGEHATREAAVQHLEAEGVNPEDYDIEEVHKHMLTLLDPDTGEILSGAIFSFRKTGLKTSRQWNSHILTEYPNADRFAGIWKMSNKTTSNSKGTWQTVQLDLIGFASEKTHAALKEHYPKWANAE